MQKRLYVVLWNAFMVIFFLSGPIHAAAPRYIYYDLGTLGGDNSNANAINHNGRVAGAAQNSTANRAYFKDPGQPMQDILAPWTDIIVGSARGINVNNYIVGDFAKADGRNRAFWRSAGLGGLYKELGTLGGNNSIAYGINSANAVVGTAQNASGHYRAFKVADPINPSMQDLGALGGNESKAQAVNDSGLTVGGAQDAAGHWLAFLKPAGTILPMFSLGVMGGGSESYAYAINNLGHVVGYAYNADWDSRPFFWKPGQTMEDLGTPAGGYGEAFGINDAGQVVGSVNYEGDWHAALWDHGSCYFLDQLTVNLPANVHLSDAKAINAQGWIVGSALIDFLSSRAFLLTPLTTGRVPLDLLLD
jgi:probable HAF family extracellular repeat protein